MDIQKWRQEYIEEFCPEVFIGGVSTGVKTPLLEHTRQMEFIEKLLSEARNEVHEARNRQNKSAPLN